jgi:hypothetical protein
MPACYHSCGVQESSPQRISSAGDGADSTSTTLDEIDANGEFHEGLTGPGQFVANGVLRAR